MNVDEIMEKVKKDFKDQPVLIENFVMDPPFIEDEIVAPELMFTFNNIQLGFNK
jgi:hypothetical protein